MPEVFVRRMKYYDGRTETCERVDAIQPFNFQVAVDMLGERDMEGAARALMRAVLTKDAAAVLRPATREFMPVGVPPSDLPDPSSFIELMETARNEVRQWGVTFMNELQQTMEVMVDARTCVEALEAAAKRLNFTGFDVVEARAVLLPPDTLDADMARMEASNA